MIDDTWQPDSSSSSGDIAFIKKTVSLSHKFESSEYVDNVTFIMKLFEIKS